MHMPALIAPAHTACFALPLAVIFIQLGCFAANRYVFDI